LTYPCYFLIFNLVSGGFATINPDNSLNINAVEAFPLEEVSLEVIKRIMGWGMKNLGTKEIIN
jgi:F0F1-type ATP synthase epsilon subunit